MTQTPEHDAGQAAGPDQSVYTDLERRVTGVPGWSPMEQLFALFLLARSSADVPGDILEIGAWCGRSSVALGLAAQMTGNTRVFAIDLFPHRDDWHENDDGTMSLTVKLEGAQVEAYHIQRVWREPYLETVKPVYANHDSVLDIFRETMAKNGLDGLVNPIRGTSDRIATIPDARFRLAFIDADHSYEAVCHDIDNVMPRLSPGGWMCFDDAFTTYEGVTRAITDRVVKSGAFDIRMQPTRKLFAARKRPAR